jgi:Flp pilus assembly protein TadB
VFVAALFLTLISVPKLVVLSVWCAYKEVLFFHLGNVLRPLQRFSKEEMAESLKKGAESPDVKLKLIMDTFGDFQKNIRDPLIEALTAALILFFLRPLLPAVSTWLIITLIVIVAVVVGAFVLTIVLWRESNRLLKMKPSKN